MERQPKYLKIVNWVKKRIEERDLSDASRLESECEISQIFDVSRQTVRHALAVLEDEGMIRSVKGSGTYIQIRKKTACLSKTVTIISTYIDSYIFPRILREMVKELEQSGYRTRIMYTENKLEQERNLLLKMIEDLHSGKEMDSLIVEPVMSGMPNPNTKLYSELKNAGMPILFFNSRYPDLDIPCISMDDVQAGKIAAEYLLQHGHRKIGGIFKMDDRQGSLRYQGMMDSLIHAGIGLNQDHIIWIDTRELNGGLRDCGRIWERLEGCTGCVCYNDEVAHILTDQAFSRGIRMPEEMSLISIDNSELARLNRIPLTSVSHPMEALGKKVAEEMMKMIRYGSVKDYYFVPKIFERSSVCDI